MEEYAPPPVPIYGWGALRPGWGPLRPDVQLPCHDLPAVWPIGNVFGLEVVLHPVMPKPRWGFLRGVPTEVVMLDKEPGRHE